MGDHETRQQAADQAREQNGIPSGNCPACQQGDLITITMTVGDSDLAFTTCHFCEAKWWQRGGESVPLSSVIDEVAES